MSRFPEPAQSDRDRASGGSADRSRIGTVRVDVQRLEQKTFEANYKSEGRSFQVLIDEPAARGGQNRAPSPLEFFATGVGG